MSADLFVFFISVQDHQSKTETFYMKSDTCHELRQKNKMMEEKECDEIKI